MDGSDEGVNSYIYNAGKRQDRIQLTMYRWQFWSDTVKLVDCQVKDPTDKSFTEATIKVTSERRET